MGCLSTLAYHRSLRQPAISLGFTAFSLLLLVLVLLSVPGPIKGLYWFSVAAEQSEEGNLSAGVLGWCGESQISFPPSSRFSVIVLVCDSEARRLYIV